VSAACKILCLTSLVGFSHIPMTDGIEIKITITKRITWDVLGSLIVGYCEGNWGANETMDGYDLVEPDNWDNYKETHTRPNTIGDSVWYYCYPLNKGGAIVFNEMADNNGEGLMGGKAQKKRLDLDAIKRGLSILEDKYPSILETIVDEDGDMWTSSALVECALYGDIITG